MAITYHKDKVIKIEYNPSNIYDIENLNIVGADATVTDRYDFVPDDDNSIFVNKNGSDSNTGTESSPVLTITKAITLCDSNKRNIVITDSGTYEETELYLNTYIDRIVAKEGCKPTIKPVNNTSAQHIEDLNVLIGATKLDKSLSGYTIVRILQTSENKLIFLLKKIDGTTINHYYYIYDLETTTTLKDITLFISNTTSNGTVDIDIELAEDGGFIFVWGKKNGADAEIWAQKRYGAEYNYEIKKGSTKILSVNPSPTDPVSIQVKCAIMPNTNYAIVFNLLSVYGAYYYNTGGLFQMDNDLSYVSSTNVTLYSYSDDTNTYSPRPQVFNDNRILVACNRSSTLYYGIYNNNTTIVSWTSIGSYTWNDVQRVGDNVAIAYSSGNNRYFKLFNSSGSTLATTNYSTQNMNGISIVADNSGGFNIVGKNAAVSITQLIFNRFSSTDGSRLANEIAHTYSTTLDITAIKFMSDANATQGEAYFVGYSGTNYYYLQYTNYMHDGIIIVKDIELNGVELNGDNYNLKYLLRGTGDITFKYCTMHAKKSGLYEANKVLAKITGGVKIYNSKLYYSDEGITCISANDIIAEYSIFYYIMYNYVFNLSCETTKTITINKCTFFNNYGGIKIDTAYYTGTVKNSIFHYHSANDIYVTNNIGTIDVSYTCYTGNMSGVDTITYSKTINPLFVDEGIYNIDNVDLHLRSIYGGYPVNSPAIGMADDGGDAGAYIVAYTVTEQVRSEIYLPKPLIQITYQPVNPAQVTTKTGQIFTKKDGLQKVYILTWRSMLNDDYDKLLDVVKCESNSIYFYPDPISSNDFINCKLIYDNLSASPQYPAQFEAGVFDCTIKLAHEVVD